MSNDVKLQNQKASHKSLEELDGFFGKTSLGHVSVHKTNTGSYELHVRDKPSQENSRTSFCVSRAGHVIMSQSLEDLNVPVQSPGLPGRYVSLKYGPQDVLLSILASKE